MIRTALILSLVLPCASFADSTYKLDLGRAVEHGSVRVEPAVSGPPGKVLRYEMTVEREGAAGHSTSNQSGTVKLGADGNGRLASNSMSIAAGDRYRVSVRVTDGDRVVAEDSAKIP
jgi:hypothetical protein